MVVRDVLWAKFKNSKIGLVFACGRRTNCDTAKQTTEMNSRRRIGVYILLQGTVNGSWGFMMVEMVVVKQKRNLDPFSPGVGQPMVIRPNGQQESIQGVE